MRCCGKASQVDERSVRNALLALLQSARAGSDHASSVGADVKIETITDLWIEETFRNLVLPADNAEAVRLLGRMNRMILTAIQAVKDRAGVEAKGGG